VNRNQREPVIGLAMVGETKGYRVILTMPEDIECCETHDSFEGIWCGNVLTPEATPWLASIMLQEDYRCTTDYSCRNSSAPIGKYRRAFAGLPRTHKGRSCGDRHTSRRACRGIGTGGTVTGRERSRRRSGMRYSPVEPAESPVFSGGKSLTHRIQGIGRRLYPQVFNKNGVDRDSNRPL